ncbi:MAG: fatty acid desaturase family protein [Terriglobia bacterium]
MRENNQSSGFHRGLEIAAIVTLLGFSADLAWRVTTSAHGLTAWTVAGSATVLGYLLADLISGFVHWLADRFGTTETPLLGANFVRPFREHHVDPLAITRHGFIETNGNNCVVSLPLLVLASLMPISQGNALRLFVVALVLSTSVFIFATNQFHKWAHMEQPPALARALQSAHLILSPDHHNRHHTAPFETYYCITTGWLNWPLEKLRAFETLERMLRRRPMETGECGVRGIQVAARVSESGNSSQRQSRDRSL